MITCEKDQFHAVAMLSREPYLATTLHSNKARAIAQFCYFWRKYYGTYSGDTETWEHSEIDFVKKTALRRKYWKWFLKNGIYQSKPQTVLVDTVFQFDHSKSE